jgi:hypothetical protein
MHQKRSRMMVSGQPGTSMAEVAITLPVVILLTFALVNLALAGYASVAAANAANYGARVGSVVQQGAAGAAATAANQSLKSTMIGKYAVGAGGGGTPGSQITVTVNWTVPNYFGSILRFLGGGNVKEFKGQARSAFRQEGW